jgi:hypothetical protein
MRTVVQLLTAGNKNLRRDVSVASRHVSLIRPGYTEAQTDDTYEVDDCFGSDLGNTEAYKRVLHPAVKQVIDGFNSSCITLGCSGSGKTTLLHGRTSGDGVVRLAIKALFEGLHNKAAQVGLLLSQHKAQGGGGQSMEFAVDASFCEVYEEKVRDLFAAARDAEAAGGKDSVKTEYLEVEETADDGWHVAGLSQRSAPDAASLQTAYAGALGHRVTGLSEYGHSKHDRAASVLTLKVSQYIPGLPSATGEIAPAQHIVSTIVIADNPGAEPLAMDPAVLRLREGARLNKAITALAGVVRALATQRREFAGHGDSVLTKILSEPLGGNCSTTILGTLKLGEWERSSAVMDLVGHARRAPCFPVVQDDAARGLQQRLRSRMLQINDARETYRDQIQSTGADGVDPNNIGLQMAKLHELEGQLLGERGDKAELLAAKEALNQRLQRLNGMDKANLAEKEELQKALIASEEDRLEIARALVEAQLESNETALQAEKTRHELVERVHELEARAIASEVRVKGAEQSYGELQNKAGSLSVENQRVKEELDQTRAELEKELREIRTEHAEVNGEVSSLKAGNEDLSADLEDMRRKVNVERRRAEDAEGERDEFRANQEMYQSNMQKKVEAAERMAEEAVKVAEETKNRLVAAAEAERDEAVAAARASKDKSVSMAQEERDEEVAKARSARDRALDEMRMEKEKAVYEARKEKDDAVALANSEKEERTLYLENDRDTRVAKAEKDKDEAIAKALRERDEAVSEAKRRSSEAIAAAQEDKEQAVAEAHRLRDLAQERLKFETERLTNSANEANGSIQGVTRAMEEARSAERMARREADRAVGEMTQLREKLESVRAEFSERLKEYMLQVGDLERGAQVLATDPNADHVLRPSQLYEAAQTLALDLHRASQDQVTDYRRTTEELQHRLTRAQRDVRALHAGYRTLRHRFEDVAPEIQGGGSSMPHEDELVGTPPTPAEARDMDARGLASKLADLRDENAALQKELRMAALDGRGPLAPQNMRAAKEAAAKGGSRPGTGEDGEIAYYNDNIKQDRDGGFGQVGKGEIVVKKNAPDDSFGGAMASAGENARLRKENAPLQKTIDELKHRRPNTTEEDMRAEVSKLRIQLHALSNQDNTRAKLTQEISVLKVTLQERTQELKEHKNHSQREAFKAQKSAIKEFTDRVQAELEKENRALQTRAAMAEEQIKEINAYMAQSTLAYQKEIMRLRTIIQATAPERLRSPVNPGLTHGHSKTQDRSGAGGAQPHQREGGRAGDKGGGVRASGQGWDRSNRPSEPLRPRSNNGA